MKLAEINKEQLFDYVKTLGWSKPVEYIGTTDVGGFGQPSIKIWITQKDSVVNRSIDFTIRLDDMSITNINSNLETISLECINNIHKYITKHLKVL